MEQGAVILYNIGALAAYSQSFVILVLRGIQPKWPIAKPTSRSFRQSLPRKPGISSIAIPEINPFFEQMVIVVYGSYILFILVCIEKMTSDVIGNC